MRRAFPALLAAVVFGLSRGTSGQQANSTALHVVSYVEVAPAAQSGLRRACSGSIGTRAGGTRQPPDGRAANKSAARIISWSWRAWQDKDAWTAHGAAAHTKQFAAELPLQLVSPVDRQLFQQPGRCRRLGDRRCRSTW
jgi:hypothetical protein